MMTPLVIQVLRDALDVEYGQRPRVAVLATVDGGGRPRARSVIVRRITDEGEVWVASDGRAEKNGQLRERPAAELVLWLAGRREQFRLTCEATVIGRGEEDRRREEAWEGLSDAARALFFWPAPGRPRGDCDDVFDREVPATVPMPDSFELIVLAPNEVDHLELGPVPHRRRRYRAGNAWEVEELNP